MLQILRCWLGRHHRDKRRVRSGGNGLLHSRCTGCGRELEKAERGWRVAE